MKPLPSLSTLPSLARSSHSDTSLSMVEDPRATAQLTHVNHTYPVQQAESSSSTHNLLATGTLTLHYLNVTTAYHLAPWTMSSLTWACSMSEEALVAPLAPSFTPRLVKEATVRDCEDRVQRTSAVVQGIING